MKRLDHETQKMYRKRLKAEALYCKYRLRRIWNSMSYGTYTRVKYGMIRSDYPYNNPRS